MEDKPEQGAHFQIEGPDEDGRVWVCSPDGRDSWCRNLGPRTRSSRSCRSGSARSRLMKRTSPPSLLKTGDRIGI